MQHVAVFGKVSSLLFPTHSAVHPIASRHEGRHNQHDPHCDHCDHCDQVIFRVARVTRCFINGCNLLFGLATNREVAQLGTGQAETVR